MKKLNVSFNKSNKTEILCIASGKGGTGKTIFCACLGYALTRAGLRVLMIDADPGTDGLSLFLLGPKGPDRIKEFGDQNTFSGLLKMHRNSKRMDPAPRPIHRGSGSLPDDHGVSYQALISNKATIIYGDETLTDDETLVPDLTIKEFRSAARSLYARLKESGNYDYVLVDTRGGFAFESSDLCALADSFIVVTEPDYTSLYQDRNLYRNINQAARQEGTRPILRAIIVNKALEGWADDPAPAGGETDELEFRNKQLAGLERNFRNELTREFPIKYSDIHPIPLDPQVMKSYKRQRIPYRDAPDSYFSYFTLCAFADILNVVTSQWNEQQVKDWNGLVDEVSQAIIIRNQKEQALLNAAREKENELKNLREEKEKLTDKVQAQVREIELIQTHYQNRLTFPGGATRDLIAYINKSAVMVLPILVTVLIVMMWIYKSTETTHRNNRIIEFSSGSEESYKTLRDPGLSIPRRQEAFEKLSNHGAKDFKRLALSGLDLNRSFLGYSSFKEADLSSADLSDAYFNDADFRGANLAQADLSDADCEEADLSDADLTQTKLRNAKFRNARLTGANLSNAVLYRTDFRGANLDYANLEGVNWLEAITDEKTSLVGVKGIENLTELSLAKANIALSRHDQEQVRQWLSDDPAYQALARMVLGTVAGKRFTNPLYLDVINGYYKAGFGLASSAYLSPENYNDKNPKHQKLLTIAFLEAYAKTYGVSAGQITDINQILEPFPTVEDGATVKNKQQAK